MKTLFPCLVIAHPFVPPPTLLGVLRPIALGVGVIRDNCFGGHIFVSLFQDFKDFKIFAPSQPFGCEQRFKNNAQTELPKIQKGNQHLVLIIIKAN